MNKYAMSSSDFDFFSGKRVLITGAGGFIGSHLLHQLRIYGAQISTIGRNRYNFSPEIEQNIMDISDIYAVNRCLLNFKPEYIFHFAGYKERETSIPAFYSSVNTNIVGALNLFASARDLDSLQSIVNMGTVEEYGNNKSPFSEEFRECPTSPYSLSKLYVSRMADLFFQSYGLPVITLRSTLVYGPGQGTEMFLPLLIISLLKNKPLDMTLGEQTRDYVYVKDLVEALITASRSTMLGQVINIGSGDTRKLSEIVKIVEDTLNKPGFVNMGGKPYRKNEIMDYRVDTRKAEKFLGWKSKTSLEEGLRQTINYYRSQYE